MTGEYNTQDHTPLKGTKGIKKTKKFSMLHRKVNKDKFYFSWTPQMNAVISSNYYMNIL